MGELRLPRVARARRAGAQKTRRGRGRARAHVAQPPAARGETSAAASAATSAAGAARAAGAAASAGARGSPPRASASAQRASRSKPSAALAAANSARARAVRAVRARAARGRRGASGSAPAAPKSTRAARRREARRAAEADDDVVVRRFGARGRERVELAGDEVEEDVAHHVRVGRPLEDLRPVEHVPVEGCRHERLLRDAAARGHKSVERVAHVADRVAVVEVEAHLEPGLVADEHLHPARDASAGEPDHTRPFGSLSLAGCFRPAHSKALARPSIYG